MARRFGMTHRHQRNNAAGGAKEQRQPQGAHFANVGNGKARNIAAEHADTHRVDRPEPAERGAGTVAADVVDNGDDKGVEEQRVGQAADAIKQQDQRIVGATRPKTRNSTWNTHHSTKPISMALRGVMISATTPETHADRAAARP